MDITSKNYHTKSTPAGVNPRSSMEPWELAYARQVGVF